jgi:integrase
MSQKKKPKPNLTEKLVAKLAAPDPSGKQVVHWDGELKGFGVQCSGVTNSKVYIVQRDLPGGKPRRVTVGAVSELALAEAKERGADLLDAIRRGQDPKAKAAAAPTLRSTLEAYLAARKTLRPASERVYRQIERTLASWMDWELSQITGPLVEARHREIAAEFGAKQTRYSGTYTANGAMRTLRFLWNFAALRTPSLPPNNPVNWLARGWYPERRRKGHVPNADLPKFYAAVRALENPVARDYLTLLLFTGFRKSEAASMLWTDVDLGQRLIHLRWASTKSGEELDLPMSDVVHDLLVARRALGVDKFIFPGAGASGHISDTQSQLAKVAKACGLLVSAHDLRRTFITIAESTENVSYLALKMMINHSLGKKSDQTAGYVQMTAERLRGPVQLVADRMKSLCGIAPVAGGNVSRMKKVSSMRAK